MRLCISIAGAFLLSACVNNDKTGTPDVIYKVQPGYWTGKSVTQYSAGDPVAPYIHDWCLTPDQVTISASELAEALAGFVSDGRGECRVSDMNAQPYRLQFGLICTLDDVEMSGRGLMSYARDGKTTDMDLSLKSAPGAEPVTFSRVAHQEILQNTCPPDAP